MIIIYHASSFIHDKVIMSRLIFVITAVIRKSNVTIVTTHDKVELVMNNILPPCINIYSIKTMV